MMGRTSVLGMGLILAGIAAAFVPLQAAPAQAASLVEQGRAGAIEGCAACHQVTRNQKPPPPVHDPDEAIDIAAPSFVEIAGKYRDMPQRLAAAITDPHHPMREQEWTQADLRAVIAYIRSLAAPQPRRTGN